MRPRFPFGPWPEHVAGYWALRSRPKQINTRLGTFGEVAYALAPKQVDQILHIAYKVFPDSAASKGEKDPNEHASTEQVALAHLMKGVHW